MLQFIGFLLLIIVIAGALFLGGISLGGTIGTIMIIAAIIVILFGIKFYNAVMLND